MFISKLYLSAKQRSMVRFFKEYHIDADHPKLEIKKSSIPNINKLLEDFNPEENFIDRRILYEITGRKTNEHEFTDSSFSDDEDSDV